jgi:DDE superfamily endonuclease
VYLILFQVIGNDQKLILELDPDWHGAAHDAQIWKDSKKKPEIEAQRRFLLAGDSAYPISDTLIKPYTNQEALGDERKRLFNSRLSGLRTEMTENVFGIWKQRFPCLRKTTSEILKTRYFKQSN